MSPALVRVRPHQPRHHAARIVSAVVVGLVAAVSAAKADPAADFPDCYDVIWNSPSKNCADSMPVGGGDIGCNVWVEGGDLFAYFQRSGSFSEIGEYLKLGRIRIRLSPNPLAAPATFRQELKLRDGCVEIEARGRGGAAFAVKVLFWVEVKRPVIHVDIEAAEPVNVLAAYENWRLQDRDLNDGQYGQRFGAYTFEGYPGRVTKLKDEVGFQGAGVLFYHHNPAHSPDPRVLIEQQGLQRYAAAIPDNISNRTMGGMLRGDGFVPTGTVDGQYLATPFRAWQLSSREPARSHHLEITTCIEQTSDVAAWKRALLVTALDSPAQREAHFEATRRWWQEFWARSWIMVSPGTVDPRSPRWQAARNYNLVRYELGCNALGGYPTKFNGGNFTFDPVAVDPSRPYDPDWRAWGGDVFTAQNQRLLYWPMLKSGDFDAMLSQFRLYQRGLAGAKIRAHAYFGHGGAVFCEYMNVPGLDFGAGWGWPAPSARERGPEVPVGTPGITGVGGYGLPVEHGIMANPAVSYHWESQVEHAYMMLEYHRYTGADLRPYLPFIDAALSFFDEHYQMREKLRSGRTLDEHGKLVFYPSTSCESYRGAKNPADLIAGIRSCLEALLALKDGEVTSARRDYYRGFLRRLPGLTFEQIDGDTVLKPAETWVKYQNSECPQFYPLFPFNRFGLDSPTIAIFRNTWKHATFPKDMVQSWHQNGIFYARMGMTAEAADYNVRKLEDSPRRFPTFWGPGHDWVPDHNWGGSGMIGLQEMLLQTVDDEIRILPAWPQDWDVDFKLHAPGDTIVECRYRSGKIEALHVTPSWRRRDVILPSGAVR